MSFSLSGLASGLDTNNIIYQLMQIERQPVIRLENQKKAISSEQSVFRSINTKLSTLEDLAFDLTVSSTFNPTKSTSSAESVVTATSTDSASFGTYNLNITKLAQSHVVQSAEMTAAADASGINGQTFTIHHADLGAPLQITATGATYAEVLENMKNDINNANAGITASVIETTTGIQRLVLNSTETGSDYRIKFGAAVDGTKTVLQDDGGLLTSLGIIDGDLNGEIDAGNETQAHQNAEFTVNGVSVTRSTNTVDDVVSGVTFNLLSTGTSTVTVGKDVDEIAGKVEEFVNAYNDVITSIRNNIKKDAQLQGNSTLRNLDTVLQNWVTAAVDSASAGFKTLAEIGISIDNGITKGAEMTGTMSFDAEKFKQKLSEDPDAVFAFFSNTDALMGNMGVATRLKENLSDWTSSVDGIISLQIKGYDSEISFIDDRIQQLNIRLAMKEESLRKQFTAMEVAMAKSQSQQSWLSGQLTQLGGWGA